MIKELLQELALPQEQAEQITKAYEESIAKALEGYVPKDKLAEVILANESLSKSLAERDKQLEEAGKAAGDNEALKKQLDEAIAKNKADSETAAAELAAYKKDSAVNIALAQFGAKNPKAVAALLDLSKVSLDGENLIGLKDQLEAVKAK